MPVVRAPNLTEAQKRVFILADNQVATLASWNDHLLAVELKEIGELDFDFSIEATGFEHAEIDIRIESLKEQTDPTSDDGDAADLVPAASSDTVTRLGDVWVIGLHRIICGDSLQADTYVGLMQGKLADMVMQDAPYNVSVKKHVGGLGKIQHREFAMASGELSKPKFAGFLSDQLTLAAEHCRPGAVLASFMDWRSIAPLIVAGEGIGLELINMCVWGKTNASMGSLWRSQHELIAMFKKPGPSVTNNVQLGKYGRYRTNLWLAPGANSFGKDRKELGDHPTPKNVALIADAIRDVTNRGDIVLDNFLGSGTTAIACERTGRVARCIELDPVYVDVAVRRLEAFSGLPAILEATGQSFAEVMAERAQPDAPVINSPVINPSPRRRMAASV
ncbi:DNA modification methylase [Rhizorhabdus argentea]|uniref:DNA modification methylase n=1 Tax=Rhizorhabdus argentea TaxID=1387174 RepID=UPI0030ECABD7